MEKEKSAIENFANSMIIGQNMLYALGFCCEISGDKIYISDRKINPLGTMELTEKLGRGNNTNGNTEVSEVSEVYMLQLFQTKPVKPQTIFQKYDLSNEAPIEIKDTRQLKEGEKLYYQVFSDQNEKIDHVAISMTGIYDTNKDFIHVRENGITDIYISINMDEQKIVIKTTAGEEENCLELTASELHLKSTALVNPDKNVIRLGEPINSTQALIANYVIKRTAGVSDELNKYVRECFSVVKAIPPHDSFPMSGKDKIYRR